MIRQFGGAKVFVSVISARRPDAVGPMTDLVGAATWFVDQESRSRYRERGEAAEQFVVADKLCEARNAAIEAAWAAGATHCLQLSDDLKKLETPVPHATQPKYIAEPLLFADAVLRMVLALDQTGARLAGVAPTNNPFYYRGKPIHTRAFIVGDMMLIKPSTPRFDLNLKLKEDYDFTLKHLDNYGCVARCDNILASFAHRTNKGGAVAYRTPEAEQEAIAYLKKRWPMFIADNPRRPNEILLKMPKLA